MNSLNRYIILVVLLGLQVWAVDLISIRGCKPDLVLIFFLLSFAGTGGFHIVIIGFLIGLAQDFIGGDFWGVNALAKTLTGFLMIKLFPDKIPDERWLYLTGMVSCIFLHDFVFWFIQGQAEYIGFWRFLWSQAIPSALYNSFIFTLVSYIGKGKRR